MTTNAEYKQSVADFVREMSRGKSIKICTEDKYTKELICAGNGYISNSKVGASKVNSD